MTRPPILYKYTSSSVAKLILSTGTLRWSSPVQFNDTDEFKRMPVLSPTIAESYSLMPQLIADIAFGEKALQEGNLEPEVAGFICMGEMLMSQGLTKEEFRNWLPNDCGVGDSLIEDALKQLFLKMAKQVRILCLTTSHDKVNMWKTYGDEHRGCALGFKLKDGSSSPMFKVRCVRYSDERPVFGSGLDFLLYRTDDTKHQEMILSILEGACYTKTRNWKLEDEWRAMQYCLLESSETSSDFSFSPGELDSITVGELASAEFLQQIKDIVSEGYPSAAVFRIARRNGMLVRLPVLGT